MYISPRKAEINELLPEPTGPTTATNSPGLTFTLMSLKIGDPLTPSQENDPFWITKASATIKSKINQFYIKSILNQLVKI